MPIGINFPTVRPERMGVDSLNLEPDRTYDSGQQLIFFGHGTKSEIGTFLNKESVEDLIVVLQYWVKTGKLEI